MGIHFGSFRTSLGTEGWGLGVKVLGFHEELSRVLTGLRFLVITLGWVFQGFLGFLRVVSKFVKIDAITLPLAPQDDDINT